MLELKLKWTVLRLDFSFFAVVALYLLLDESGFGLAALAACAMHETGHLLAMAIFGVPVEELTLYGAGISISSSAVDRAKPLRRAVIFGAGVFVNFTAAAAFWLAGEYAAAAVNLFTGIFNLLPLGGLDGARLLKMLALKKCRAENVDRVIRAASIASAAVCAAAVLALGGEAPFTLITTAVYIIIISGIANMPPQ